MTPGTAEDLSGDIDYRDAADLGLRRNMISSVALEVIDALQWSDYKSYVVGGSVRDLLLGKTPKDYDVVTDAHPGQVLELFPRCRIVGRRFRIVHVYLRGELVEVSTFRSLWKPEDKARNRGGRMVRNGQIIRDNRYGSLHEDIFRRDFTVNSIYYDPCGGKVIAHRNALEDIESRCLRFIGADARARYREDPVRMLRAVRLAAKAELQMHDEVEHHIAPSASLLGNVPPARLFQEFSKIFRSGAALEIYHLLRRYKLFDVMFPSVRECLDRDDESGRGEVLVELLFSRIDQRIAAGKSVMSAFPMAVMLWLPVTCRLRGRKTSAAALRKLLKEALSAQRRYIATPAWIADNGMDICLLQPHFGSRRKASLLRLAEHPGFAAAYNLMCLCADAGLGDPDTAEWWTRFRQSDESERRSMIERRASGRRRRGRG